VPAVRRVQQKIGRRYFESETLERLMPLRPVTQFVVTAGACAV